MAAWKGNGYLYIGLYVFIFLTVLLGIQILSRKAEAYSPSQQKTSKKKKYRGANTNTDSGDVLDCLNTTTDVFDVFTTDTQPEVLNTTTSIHELDNMNDIFLKTKGRSKGEKLCRYYLEDIYKKPFPSIFPEFLRYAETDAKLELDGYSKELGIAFEYNGRQHYEYVPHFHRNGYSDFIKQIQRDKFKREKCKKKGIYLITVPYTIPHDEIKDCIDFYLPEHVEHRRKLQQMGYNIPEEYVPSKKRLQDV